MDDTRKKQLAIEAANRKAAQANKELDQSDQSDPTEPTNLAVSYTDIPEEHANTGKVYFPD